MTDEPYVVGLNGPEMFVCDHEVLMRRIREELDRISPPRVPWRKRPRAVWRAICGRRT